MKESWSEILWNEKIRRHEVVDIAEKVTWLEKLRNEKIELKQFKSKLPPQPSMIVDQTVIFLQLVNFDFQYEVH